MAIKILRQGLPIIGHAKIGEASLRSSRLRGAPFKFDHIELTGIARDKEGRLVTDHDQIAAVLESGAATCGGCERSKALGYADGLPVEMGILLQSNSLEVVLPNRLAWYRGRTAFCVGDGEAAQRLTIEGEKEVTGSDKVKRMVTVYGPARDHGPCGFDCPDLQDRKCKPNGKFRFTLATQQTVGGVYEFRTTSWASLGNLTASLKEILLTTGGLMAWLPLMFRIVKGTVQPRDGAATNAMLAMVTPPPGGPEALLGMAADVLRLRAPLMREVKLLDANLQKTIKWDESDEEIQAARDEFDMGTEDTGAPIFRVPGATDADRDAGALNVNGDAVEDGDAATPPTAAEDEPGGGEPPAADSTDAGQDEPAAGESLDGSGEPPPNDGASERATPPPDSPVIEDGQWRVLTAKAQFKAEQLGFEGDDAGSTLLRDVLEQLHTPRKDARRSEVDAILAGIDRYTAG